MLVANKQSTMPKKKRRGGSLGYKHVKRGSKCPQGTAANQDQASSEHEEEEATVDEQDTNTELEIANARDDGPSTEEEVEAFLREEEPLFEKETLLEDKRRAVAILYEFGFGGPEPCDWEHGMMAKIKKSLGYHESSDIKNILLDIVYCKRHGLQYSLKLK